MTARAKELRSSLRDLLADAWQLLRQPMTPGQRQSALLIVPLTIALVLYGRPAETTDPAPSTPLAPVVGAPFDELRDVTPTETAAPPSPVAAPTAPAAPSTPRPPTAASSSTIPDQPMRIVAVVRPSPDEEAVSDRDLALAFLRSRGVEAAVVELGPPEVCEDVLRRGTLVLAGVGVGPGLRACLVEGGATLVAYDELGDAPRGQLGAGEVLSTRRGFGDSIVELASWARSADRLGDPVGLVTMEAARALTGDVIRRLADQGVEVTSVAYLPDDDAEVAVSQGVVDFAASGVGATIFAAPVAAQRSWLAQSSLLSPAMTYLVADVFDAVVETGYPDGFVGATLTTLQHPWSSAGAGLRADCDRTWADSGGTELSGSVAVRMYAWCQHVALAARAGAAGTSAATLRGGTLDSPLTTRLGPLPDGQWGPTQHRPLEWDTSCACWTAEGAPMDRSVRKRG